MTRPWLTVGLLAALFVFSFVDRLILALLAPPIAAELGLTDGQLGMLIGFGFAVVYSVAGLPLAHFIDTRRRKNIIVAGVTLWSISTIASGFAQDFFSLLACRAMLAIGEAVLSPAAVSVIADLFSKEKRGGPMALYMSVSGIMGTGAFIVGAGALNAAEHLAPLLSMAPWRIALCLVGLPSLFLVVLFAWLTHEPGRTGSNHDGSSTFADFATFFARSGWFYGPMMLGSAILCCYVYGMSAWLPTILVRSYGLSTTSAGFAYGLVGVPAAVSSAFFWPFLAQYLEKRMPGRGLPTTFLLLSCLILPQLILVPLVTDRPTFLSLLFPLIFFGSGLAILPSLTFQAFAPSRMRARMMAVHLLGLNVFGLALGPMLIVWLGKMTPNVAHPLSMGLSILGGGVGPVALVLFGISARRVADAAQNADNEGRIDSPGSLQGLEVGHLSR